MTEHQLQRLIAEIQESRALISRKLDSLILLLIGFILFFIALFS